HPRRDHLNCPVLLSRGVDPGLLDWPADQQGEPILHVPNHPQKPLEVPNGSRRDRYACRYAQLMRGEAPACGSRVAEPHRGVDGRNVSEGRLWNLLAYTPPLEVALFLDVLPDKRRAIKHPGSEIGELDHNGPEANCIRGRKMHPDEGAVWLGDGLLKAFRV